MAEFVQSEIDAYIKSKSVIELYYILQKSQLELKRRDTMNFDTKYYKQDYDEMVRIMKELQCDDEEIYKAPEWNELEEFIKSLSNSLELVHYNDTNEDDDWLCYEDGSSIKRVWKMPSGELITFKYVTHSSKHTNTLHYMWEYKENNITFSYGTYTNGIKATENPFDFKEVLKTLGCSQTHSTNVFYRYCLLKYVGGADFDSENIFEQDENSEFLVEVLID